MKDSDVWGAIGTVIAIAFGLILFTTMMEARRK